MELTINKTYVNKIINCFFIFLCMFFVIKTIQKKPLIYTAIIFGIIAFFLLMKDIKLTILIFSIYVALESFILKWLPPGIYEIIRLGWEFILYFIFFLFIIQKALKGKTIIVGPINKFIVCYILCALISILLNNFPFFWGIAGLRTLLRYTVLYYLIINLNIDEKFIKKLLYVILLVIIIQCISGYGQKLAGEKIISFFSPVNTTIGTITFGARDPIEKKYLWVFGTMERYNMLGYFLSFFLPFYLSFYIYKIKLYSKKFLFWFLIITFILLILTYSRTAWLGLYFGLLFILHISGKKKKLMIFAFIPIIFTLILYLWITIKNYDTEFITSFEAKTKITERYLEMFTKTYFLQSREASRVAVFEKVSLAVLKTNPFFGYGTGFVEYSNIDLLKEYTNKRLEKMGITREIGLLIGDAGWVVFLFQTGITGLFLWMILCLTLIKKSILVYRFSKNPLYSIIGLSYTCSVIGIMVGNIFSYNFVYRTSSFYFWLFGGIVMNLYLKEKALPRKETIQISEINFVR